MVASCHSCFEFLGDMLQLAGATQLRDRERHRSRAHVVVADAIHRRLQFGHGAAAAIQRGGIRQREHARRETRFGADDTGDLFVGDVLVRQHFAHAHGDVRKRRQLDPARGHFLRRVRLTNSNARGVLGGHGGFVGGWRVSGRAHGRGIGK